MRFLVALFVALTLSAPALAQQQPQSSVQDQLIQTYTNINTNLAKQLDAANAHVADLQRQLDAERAKNAPKPVEPKKP